MCSYSASVKNSILCSLILLMSRSVAALADEFCPEHYWWDHERDDCIRCAVCDDQSIVLRPCQPHQDVVCGTLSDLEYDLNWLAAAGAPKQRVRANHSLLLFFTNAIFPHQMYIHCTHHSFLWLQLQQRGRSVCAEIKIKINSISSSFFFSFLFWMHFHNHTHTGLDKQS